MLIVDGSAPATGALVAAAGAGAAFGATGAGVPAAGSEVSCLFLFLA